jgi:transcriptional regulator with PAS, ATPase and Fis domain
MSEETTRARDRAHVVHYPRVRLTVTHGPDAGLSCEVAAGSASIGTSHENDLVLSDETVSRHHCDVVSTESGVQIRDDGSTNGVRSGSAWIRDATFTGPIDINLGQTVVSVVPLAETVEREQLSVDRFGYLLGRSAKMRELFADLERVAPSELSLLIQGETGTGKELVAESVHQASPRRDGPFVVFDCGAVAPTLLESELFGHERGAFTGAVTSRAGLFEQACGGTIFLDELGELPKDLQPKLLRVLERRELKRVGSSKAIALDVRLISATNRNLRAEVKRGDFREDLYYRVAGAELQVAPLRDRMDDLPLLANAFLAAQVPPRSLDEVPPHIWEMFRAHRWPGNVRELRNAVQRVLVLPERALERDPTAPAAPPPSAESFAPFLLARREAADAFEQAYLKGVLAKSGGNVTRAGALAQISRQMLHKLIAKHGL